MSCFPQKNRQLILVSPLDSDQASLQVLLGQIQKVALTLECWPYKLSVAFLCQLNARVFMSSHHCHHCGQNSTSSAFATSLRLSAQTLSKLLSARASISSAQPLAKDPREVLHRLQGISSTEPFLLSSNFSLQIPPAVASLNLISTAELIGTVILCLGSTSLCPTGVHQGSSQMFLCFRACSPTLPVIYVPKKLWCVFCPVLYLFVVGGRVLYHLSWPETEDTVITWYMLKFKCLGIFTYRVMYLELWKCQPICELIAV